MDKRTTSQNTYRQENEELTAVRNHLPCPDCGSSDALTENDNGSTKCFSCGTFTPKGEPSSPTSRKEAWVQGLAHGEYQTLTKRKIPEHICRLWDYSVGEYQGKRVQIATYRNLDGDVIGQKLRYPDKTFRILGKVNTFFGANKFGKGKRLVVTEGEIDALSVATVMDGKWPVVSIPNGAQGAERMFKENSEYLEKFEEVIIMFDMDEAGRQASKNCASTLSIGKVKIANLPMKDPSELLMANRGAEILQAFWNAQPWRPDGIVSGDEMWELVSDMSPVPSTPYPYVGLNKKTLGMRKGEIVTFTAGSGVGKSSMCREIAYHLLNQKEKVGYIALEESIKRSAHGIMGLHMNVPLHLGQHKISEERLREAYDATVGSGNYFTYDHWGSIESDNLINRIRYMHKGLGCDWVFLDHVSIVVSGQDGDERKMLDILMTKLRSLVEETNIGMALISHLKRPDGRGFEEGRQITLGDLRGSAGLGQLSDIVIGIERDQQSDEESNRSTVRVLKNRFTGYTGLACHLDYNMDTGRLSEDTSMMPEEASPFKDETVREAEVSSSVDATDNTGGLVAPF